MRVCASALCRGGESSWGTLGLHLQIDALPLLLAPGLLKQVFKAASAPKEAVEDILGCSAGGEGKAALLSICRAGQGAWLCHEPATAQGRCHQATLATESTQV